MGGDDKTEMVPTPLVTTPPPGGSTQQQPVTLPEDRTRIVRPGGDDAVDDGPVERKIIGWLVTYETNPSGVDYRMREGQNDVGRNPDCKIHVKGDNELSGKHGMFLFRSGELYFRDEMASNATVIDGVVVGPGETVAVKDGAQIKMGSFTYLYRAAGF